MAIRRWLGRLAGKSAASPPAGGRITPERLQRVFDYSRQTRVESIGAPSENEVPRHLQFTLTFHPEPYVIDFRRAAKPYRRDEVIHTPAHLTFSWMPRFANVALVDGGIVYHWGENGEAAFRNCPVTRDPAQIALIDQVFDIWEAKLEDMRRKEAAQAAKAARHPALDRSNPMALIRYYIQHGDAPYLFDVLGAPDADDIILWVDQGEEDDAIVSNCAAILGLRGLSARFVDRADGVALELIRDGKVTLVDYGGYADRDKTLVALDAVLRPDYELRYCRDSDGSSVAAFLPLPRADWAALDGAYPQDVARRFATISPAAPIFD